MYKATPVALVVLLLLLLPAFSSVALAAAEAIHVEITGDSSALATTAPIEGATPELLPFLQQERRGPDFHYSISGLPPASKLIIELGFAELSYSKPGQRLFNVDVNDRRALSDFDIVATAGGPLRAVSRKFSITPRRGYIDVHLTGLVSDAVISYIRLQGMGVNLLVGAQAPELRSEQASYNPATGEIHQDEQHKTWLSGVPAGGIGTGKLELLPNGAFANLSINNSWDLPVRTAPGCFVAIAAKTASYKGSARVMTIREPFSKLPQFGDAQGVPSGTYTGLYPVGTLSLDDTGLPLRVVISTFSPMVPQSERDSSLPAAIVNVQLENPNSFPVNCAAALSWENLNGIGGSRRKGDQFARAASIVHTEATNAGLSGIQMTTNDPVDGRRGTFLGEYFVGVESTGALVTRQLQWSPEDRAIPWWKQFAAKCRLQSFGKPPLEWRGGDPALSNAAVVCATVNLAPKEKRNVPFIVSWYMPRIYMEKDRKAVTESPDYVTSFSSALSVAEYVSANRARLFRDTVEWQDMVADSNLPEWLKIKLINSGFPMSANSIYARGGKFSMLESPEDMRGALGTMDQRLASHAFVSTMYPALNARELDLFGSLQQPDGRIPHFSGNLHQSLADPTVDFGLTDWPDVAASWIMQVVKHYRATGDDKFLARNYPRILKAIEFLASLDKDLDAIPEGGSSFDYEAPVSGTFVYNASTYLGALRAARSAAEAMGDAGNAEQLNSRLVKALTNVVRELWAGDHFIKRYAPATDESTSTSFVAALAGDWMARSTGLPPTLPDDLASTAISAILQKNIAPFKPVPAMEVTTEGLEVVHDCYLAQLEPYVGCEAIYLGDPDGGLDVISRMYDVAYKVSANAWGQSLNYHSPEAGQSRLRSYMTAPATWHVLPALTGIALDVPNKTMFFNPQIPTAMKGELHVPVFTPIFWGYLDYSAADRHGTLAITKVFPEHGERTIERIARHVDVDGRLVDEKVLPKPFVIRENEVLQLD